MRNLARVLAVSIFASLGLVPLQAPASAQAGTLDVTITRTGVTNPEVAQIVTDYFITLTATNTPAPTADTTVNFDTDGVVLTPEETCTIMANTTSCTVKINEASEPDVRAWVEDGGAIPPCGLPIMGADCDSSEGQDESDPAQAGDTPEPDDTDVVTLEWLDGTLELDDSPPIAVAPGGNVSVTATVMSTEMTPRGLLANVDAEILAGSPNANKIAGDIDMECDTNQAGTCPLTYTAGPSAGVDKIRGWIDTNDDPTASPQTGDETDTTSADFEGDETEDTTAGTTDEPDNTDVVEVSISAAQVLNVEPEASTKTVGTPVTLTASVTLGGAVQNNTKVAAVVKTGPNATKVLTCTTGSGGTCPLTYTGTTVGVDLLQAAVDSDGNGQPNEADQTEGLTGSGADQGGVTDPDITDVVQVTWQAQTPPDDGGGGDDAAKCDEAKQKLKKAKKALKKAKASGDEDRIKKSKKKVKKAKRRKVAACAGVA